MTNVIVAVVFTLLAAGVLAWMVVEARRYSKTKQLLEKELDQAWSRYVRALGRDIDKGSR